MPERAARALGLPLRPGRARRPAGRARGRQHRRGRPAARCSPPRSATSIPVVQVRNPGLAREGFERVVREALGATQGDLAGRGHRRRRHARARGRPLPLRLSRRASCSAARAIPPTRTTAPWRRTASGCRARATPDGARIEVVAAAHAAAAGARRPAPARELRELLRRRTRPCSCPPSTIPPTARPSGILAELFPDRPVIGIHAVDLVWGLGTLHCLTQQQPRLDAAARLARRALASRGQAPAGLVRNWSFISSNAPSSSLRARRRCSVLR